jgi:hypothetical protein
MWLGFVLYLDLRYDKFPAVLLGGIKILLASYVVLALSYLLWRALLFACKRGRAIVKIR